jgi:hypothetical protein
MKEGDSRHWQACERLPGGAIAVDSLHVLRVILAKGDAKGMRQYRHESIPKCAAERVIELYNKGRKVQLDKL